MNRLKQWLKNKLRVWMGIDFIENYINTHIIANGKEFEEIYESISKNNALLKKINSNIDNLKSSNISDHKHFLEMIAMNKNMLKSLQTTIESVVHIGTDVRESRNYRSGHSWAVICIEGNMNLVKFIDLSDRKYAIDILQFLKQYEAGRHCIDTPSQKMFYDTLHNLKVLERGKRRTMGCYEEVCDDRLTDEM